MAREGSRTRSARGEARSLELRLGLATVSFQRYALPEGGVVASPPRSHGALPVAASGGEFLVPVPDGEAFWVGLVARSARVRVLARVIAETDAGRIDAASGAALGEGEAPAIGFAVPPTVSVPGLVRARGGAWCFARGAAAPGAPACTALELDVIPACAVTSAVATRSAVPQRQPGSGAPREPSTATAAVGAEWRLDRRAAARVRLVSPSEFAARGLAPPAPLRADAAYRGWRLP